MPLKLFLLVLTSLCVQTQKSEPSFSSSDVFRASDKYDFAVEVPAAKMDCFWHFARWGGSFSLTYLVQWVTGMANDRRLFVTINSPEGALMGSRNSPNGQIIFTTEETGFYPVCFGNFHNRFGILRVFVNLDVIYEDLEDPGTGMEEAEKALNSTLTSIEDSVQRLQRQIFLVWHHYKFARARESRDHHLLLSNLSYVNWWSATQSLVIVLSGYLQLFILKRLFTTDSSRPRC